MDNINDIKMKCDYNWVIENTLRDVTRVHIQWMCVNKKYDYGDLQSLFRSYLAKHLKTKFGWRTYPSFIRYCDPTICFDYGGFLYIITNDSRSYSSTKDFVKVVEEFDYISFSGVLEKEFKELRQKLQNKSINLESIDFTDIENIKF